MSDVNETRAPGSSWPYSPIVRLFQQARVAGGVDAKRVPRLLLLLSRFVCLEPFRLLERLIYGRRIRKHVPAQAPVFILGHWRSGTSHLQELLQQDPRFCTSTIYRSAFADVFYMTEAWLKPVLAWCARLVGARYHIQRTALDFDMPAESDVALTSLSSTSSYSWGHLFPRDFPSILSRVVVDADEETASAWLRDLDFLTRKLSLHSGGKRVVMKSPGDTARVLQLLRVYPDARFIYIHRDPLEVFQSNRYLWEQIDRDMAFQETTAHERDAFILDGYKRIIGAYLQQRTFVPASQLAEMHYARLAADPLAELRRVYDLLSLGAFPQRELESFVKSRPAYRPVSHPRDAELEALIGSAWNFAHEDEPFAIQDRSGLSK